jgi:DNA-binding CsgD family transcriptional regulator
VTVLAASGLLAAAPGTRIAAELVRRWVYRGIPPMERSQLHASAVRALSTHGPADRAALARHSGLSGDWEAASRFGEDAADQAMLAGNTAAALGLLQQLVAQAPAGSSARVRLTVKLAGLAPLSVHRDETFALLRELVRDERLPAGIRGEIRLDFGLLLMNQLGHSEDGWKEITRAVSELHRRPALAARGMAALSVPHWGSCHVDEHRWWADRAKQTVARVRDPAIAAAVVGNELSLLMNIGDPSIWDQVSQLADHDGSVAQRQQAGRAYCNLADAAAWLGHGQRAARFLREGLRLAGDAGAAYAVGLGNGTQLRLEFAFGRWADLGRRARLLLGEPAGLPVIADARLVLAQLALTRGEWAEALGLMEVPGLRGPHIGCAPQLCAASAVRITSFTAMKQPGMAGQELATALDRVRAKGIWGWAGDLLHAAVQFLIGQGLEADAGRLVDETTAQIAGQDTPLVAATVMYCQGALCEAAGDLSGAVTGYELAAAAYQAIDRPYDQARAAEAASRCRLATGEQAEDQLRVAASRYNALGAAWDASRCGHLLRQYGAVPPRPRRGRRGYGPSLSPREQQVGRLMALGRTNREIAEVLFLSPRTVELHAARVLRKMAVSDRGELAGLPEPE